MKTELTDIVSVSGEVEVPYDASQRERIQRLLTTMTLQLLVRKAKTQAREAEERFCGIIDFSIHVDPFDMPDKTLASYVASARVLKAPYQSSQE